MAVNLNALAASLPANNYKLDGGLGGAVSGMQIADYLDNRERGTRSDDLEYEAKQNELMNALADNPQKELARQLALTKGGAEQDLFKTGLPQQAAKLKLEDEIKTIQMKEGPRALDKLEEQSRYWEALSEAHSRGVLDQHRDLFVKQGAALGLPPVNFNDPNLGATLAKYKQRAVETRDVLGKLRVQKQQQDWQGGENEADRKNRLEMARIAAGKQRSTVPENNMLMDIQAKDTIEEKDLTKMTTIMDLRLKQTGDMAALEKDKASLRNIWSPNPKKQVEDKSHFGIKMKDYKSDEAWAEAVINARKAEEISSKIEAYLMDKPLVIKGETVGVIGENAADKLREVVYKRYGVDYKGGNTNARQNSPTQGVAAGATPQAAGPSKAPAVKPVKARTEADVTPALVSGFKTQILGKYKNDYQDAIDAVKADKAKTPYEQAMKTQVITALAQELLQSQTKKATDELPPPVVMDPNGAPM